MSGSGPGPRRWPARVDRFPGPEWIAGLLVVVLYGGVATAWAAAAGDGRGGDGATFASSSPTGAAPAASVSPGYRQEALSLLEIDRRLLDGREELVAILARPAFRSSDAALALRRVNAILRYGLETARRLSDYPDGRELGGRLELLYSEARTSAADALGAPLANAEVYRVAAERIVDSLAGLIPLDEALAALAERGVSSSQLPSPSLPGSAAPVVSPSPAASSGPPASPRLQPTPQPGEQLRNGGFETGLSPWRLVLGGPGDRATADADAALGTDGQASLRIDVQATSGGRGSVILTQDGLELQAGGRYTARLTVRSSPARDVRVRVLGPRGEVFAARVVRIDDAAEDVVVSWTGVVDATAASLQLDVGTESGSVWIDDASLVGVSR